jgi:formate hydrogenlyase subunit 6/NADH:ubiquinone oxidoreductase subunit I
MSKPRKSRPVSHSIELPILDETLCTGCGTCPEACPTACLAMGPHLPWLPRPAECVACALCVEVCPAAALQMTSVSPRPAKIDAQA